MKLYDILTAYEGVNDIVLIDVTNEFETLNKNNIFRLLINLNHDYRKSESFNKINLSLERYGFEIVDIKFNVHDFGTTLNYLIKEL